MPKARTIVGRAIIDGFFGFLAGKSFWSAAAGAAALAFADNIGGEIAGTFKYGVTYQGCYADQFVPSPY